MNVEKNSLDRLTQLLD